MGQQGKEGVEGEHFDVIGAGGCAPPVLFERPCDPTAAQCPRAASVTDKGACMFPHCVQFGRPLPLGECVDADEVLDLSLSRCAFCSKPARNIAVTADLQLCIRTCREHVGRAFEVLDYPDKAPIMGRNAQERLADLARMLDAYRDKNRPFPTYAELAALVQG